MDVEYYGNPMTSKMVYWKIQTDFTIFEVILKWLDYHHLLQQVYYYAILEWIIHKSSFNGLFGNFDKIYEKSWDPFLISGKSFTYLSLNAQIENETLKGLKICDN